MLWKFYEYCTQLGMSHPDMAKAAGFARSKPDYYGFTGFVLIDKYLTREEMLALDAMRVIAKAPTIQLESDPAHQVDYAIRCSTIVPGPDEKDELDHVRAAMADWAAYVLEGRRNPRSIADFGIR